MSTWSPCPAKADRLFDVAHGWATGEDGVVQCVLCGAIKPGESMPDPTEERVPVWLTREEVRWLRDTCDDHSAGIDARRGTDREEQWDSEDYPMAIAIAEQLREPNHE